MPEEFDGWSDDQPEDEYEDVPLDRQEHRERGDWYIDEPDEDDYYDS